MLQLFIAQAADAAADPVVVEPLGRIGDGSLISTVLMLAIGFLVGLMAGWLGIKRPKMLGG